VTPGGPESLSVAFSTWFLPEETASKSLEDIPGPNSTARDGEFKMLCYGDVPTYQCGAVLIEHRRHAYPLQAGSEWGKFAWFVGPCWSSAGLFGDSTADGGLIPPLRSALGHRSPTKRTWIK
jgi:hypothetical protein